MENQIKNLPILNKLPSKDDGRDGVTYIVRDKGSVYLYHKHNKSWFRTKMEEM